MRNLRGNDTLVLVTSEINKMKEKRQIKEILSVEIDVQ